MRLKSEGLAVRVIPIIRAEGQNGAIAGCFRQASPESSPLNSHFCVIIGRVASKGDRCLGVRTSESSFSEPHQYGPTYCMCDGVRRGNLPVHI